MKIVAPLTHVEAYAPLVQAGADEFFCGFIPYGWLKKYQVTVPINRREYFLKRFQTNICGLGHMKILGRAVRTHGIPVKVALNAHYYIEGAYPLLAALVVDLGELGFDTFIISDPALMVYLRDQGIRCKIHLSGELMVLSYQSLSFFERFDVTRLIFPRKIDLDNVGRLTARNPSMEYEAFVLNSLCPWSGGLCQSLHTDELPHLCEEVYSVSPTGAGSRRFPGLDETLEEMREIKFLHAAGRTPAARRARERYSLGKEGCGLCRIRKMADVGITHLKVVGRGYALEQLVHDVRHVKQCIRLSEDVRDQSRYAEIVRNNLFGGKCPEAVGGCYYLGD
jgi:collagenase-like PrtC family protease